MSQWRSRTYNLKLIPLKGLSSPCHLPRTLNLETRRLICTYAGLLFPGSPSLEGPTSFRFYAAWLFAGLDLEASRPSLNLSDRCQLSQWWGLRAERSKVWTLKPRALPWICPIDASCPNGGACELKGPNS